MLLPNIYPEYIGPYNIFIPTVKNFLNNRREDINSFNVDGTIKSLLENNIIKNSWHFREVLGLVRRKYLFSIVLLRNF